jgi:hypothetical protein
MSLDLKGTFFMFSLLIETSTKCLILGLCIGQVQCIFSLPSHAIDLWFLIQTAGFSQKHLAYIEWFTTFPRAQKNHNSKLFKVSCLMAQGERCVSIVPVSLILLSIQLLPKFGPQAPVSHGH